MYANNENLPFFLLELRKFDECAIHHCKLLTEYFRIRIVQRNHLQKVHFEIFFYNPFVVVNECPFVKKNWSKNYEKNSKNLNILNALQMKLHYVSRCLASFVQVNIELVFWIAHWRFRVVKVVCHHIVSQHLIPNQII